MPAMSTAKYVTISSMLESNETAADAPTAIPGLGSPVRKIAGPHRACVELDVRVRCWARPRHRFTS